MTLSKDVIGMTSEPYSFTVNQSHIKQFADAIGDQNELYRNEDYAMESAYKNVIPPPTFLIAIQSAGGSLPIDLDYRRMLHGEQGFQYFQNIHPGDELTCQMKVVDLYEREGKQGLMQFLVIDTEIKKADESLVAISKMTIIYR